MVQLKEIKYLGIIFDSKLIFNSHIAYISEKARKLVYRLSKTAKLNWGLGHKAMKIIRRAQVNVGLINLCKGLFSLNARIYYKLKSGT